MGCRTLLGASACLPLSCMHVLLLPASGCAVLCPVGVLPVATAVYSQQHHICNRCCSSCGSDATGSTKMLTMDVTMRALADNACAVCSAAGSYWHHGSLSAFILPPSAVAAPFSLTSSSTSRVQSSSSAFSHVRSASTQAPLMRMQQQQQQDQHGSSSRTPWGKLLAGGAAAAGAAAAGWAVWSESDAARRAQALAEESNRAGLPRCSVTTQVRGLSLSSIACSSWSYELIG
jgi:hypothetical protein